VNFNRREFLVLAAAIAAPGCQSSSEDTGHPAEPRAARTINAGPAAHYTADGVYERFHEQGFFLVRRGEKLFAITAVCTHRRCKLKTERDHTFYCPCHGSTFDVDGHVTKGPARKELPFFTTSVNAQGELLVSVPAS
jgi:Rieske Fe-S protein